MRTGACTLWLVQVGNKGIEAWSAAYLEELGMPTLARGCGMAASLGKVAGDALCMLPIARQLGRLRMLQWSFCMCGVLVYLFVRISSAPLLLTTSFATFLCSDVIWCNVYMLLAESFPTAVRGTAFGIVMGLGRGGGVIGAAVGGALPSMQHAFTLYAASFASGGALVCLYTRETSQQTLPDVV
jgi:hypothetical protein